MSPTPLQSNTGQVRPRGVYETQEVDCSRLGRPILCTDKKWPVSTFPHTMLVMETLIPQDQAEQTLPELRKGH